MTTPCFTLRVAPAAEALGISRAQIYNMMNSDRLAYFRDGGVTSIVNDWPGEPPPREGRAPSIREYIAEQLAKMAVEPPAKRGMPQGVHRGRPRRHSVVAE